MCSLLYVYACRVNARIEHGMGCQGRVLSLTHCLSFLSLLSPVTHPCFPLSQVRESLELTGTFSGAGIGSLSHGSMCKILPNLGSQVSFWLCQVNVFCFWESKHVMQLSYCIWCVQLCNDGYVMSCDQKVMFLNVLGLRYVFGQRYCSI